jgi:glycosyltransferase involved in cell wall biosynthesis
LKTQSSSPRILLVVPFTKPDYSGSGLNALNFAKFLNRQGHSASILTFNRNLQLKSREFIEHAPVHRIPYFNRNLLLKGLSLFSIIPAYMKYLIRSDIILIYGAHIIAYQFLVIFGHLMGKKIVFRSLLLGADDMKTMLKRRSGIARKFRTWLFRKIDLYFAINPAFAEAYREYIGKEDRILVSPQGVDLSFFKPSSEEERTRSRKEMGIGDSCFLILSVGFLINRKGFSGIFRVLQKLDFEFRYIIAGEYEFGSDHFMKKHSFQAAELKNEGTGALGTKLKLTGPVEDIENYYRVADLVLINSLSEGMPNTLLEAMACGKVALVKDFPGIRFLIEHMETGVIFQNETEMHGYLNRLRNEHGLRRQIGASAAEHIRSTASFEQVWSKLQNKLMHNQ